MPNSSSPQDSVAEARAKTVSSVGELIQQVRERALATNRVQWFRGQHSAGWDVEATIWRDYDKREERNLTNRFRARATTRIQSLPGYDDCAHWLIGSV
jgi:hypothetical protein